MLWNVFFFEIILLHKQRGILMELSEKAEAQELICQFVESAVKMQKIGFTDLFFTRHFEGKKKLKDVFELFHLDGLENFYNLDQSLTGFTFGLDQEGWLILFYLEGHNDPLEYGVVTNVLNQERELSDIKYFATALFNGDFGGGQGEQLLCYGPLKEDV